MQRSLVYTAILSFFLLGCQNITPVQAPERLIPKQKMESIMYDIAIVNAARGLNVQRLKRYNVSPETYIFEKHNIDSLQFAQSTVYYAANSEEYKEMYLNIEARIEALRKDFQDKEDAFQRRKDSIRTAQVLARRKRDSIKRANGDTTKTTKVQFKRPDISKSAQF
ncbi:MAG: hypothetical protein CL867_12225 [Cytophagaceae bacterium]|nr:hypothetical protein [Cytophagaceae bacterium]